MAIFKNECMCGPIASGFAFKEFPNACGGES